MVYLLCESELFLTGELTISEVGWEVRGVVWSWVVRLLGLSLPGACGACGLGGGGCGASSELSGDIRPGL